MKKFGSTEAELKNRVAYKKSMYFLNISRTPSGN